MRRTAGLGLALGALLCLPPLATGSRRPREARGVLYGVTIDRITGLSETLTSLRALPDRPTLRVVFDRSEPARYYAAATRRLAGASFVMGELLDSSAERSISASALRTRARTYLRQLGPYVSVWELGNELNGNWTGPYAQVAAKTRAAFSVLSAARAPLALTLYANDFAPDHCGDGPAELTPPQFARRYLPPRSAPGCPTCSSPTTRRSARASSPRPQSSPSTSARSMPSSGTPSSGSERSGFPGPSRVRRPQRRRQIMRWAYGLDPHLRYYAGGYFWWYGAEDALRPGAPLRGELARGFNSERAALGGSRRQAARSARGRRRSPACACSWPGAARRSRSSAAPTRPVRLSVESRRLNQR